MIRARYIMSKKPAVRPDATGREVFYKMMAAGSPGLPVINGNMEVTGVITSFDLLKAVRSGKKMDDITVEQVISRAPQSAGLDTPLETLIDMMINNNYSIIPIVKNKRLVGIVSRKEILEAYAEPQLYESVEELAPDAFAQ